VVEKLGDPTKAFTRRPRHLGKIDAALVARRWFADWR